MIFFKKTHDNLFEFAGTGCKMNKMYQPGNKFFQLFAIVFATPSQKFLT